MDIQAKKIEIMEMLLKVSSESLINQMEQLLKKKMIVGYSTDGKPLTLEAYNKRIKTAEKQIAAGKMTSHEDLEKEMEQW